MILLLEIKQVNHIVLYCYIYIVYTVLFLYSHNLLATTTQWHEAFGVTVCYPPRLLLFIFPTVSDVKAVSFDLCANLTYTFPTCFPLPHFLFNKTDVCIF